MSEDLDQIIEKIGVHAWGTPSWNSPEVLSDALLQLAQGKYIDLDVLRLTVLNDLQLLNIALRKLNAEEVQPEFVSMKLTYIASKIQLLLLKSASEVIQPYSSQLVEFATDFAEAWHCLLSCDIEDVREGF